MESSNSTVHWQLANLFNIMFSKDSLRKNTYIFNSLNERMEISIRTIAKERKVVQITNDIQQITSALKECPLVQVISHNYLRILMKGDEVIVKLTSLEPKRIDKKEVQILTKNMKCDLKQNSDNFMIEFQSHAAVMEFIQRITLANKGYHHETLQKNPYRCIADSINNFRLEKKNTKYSSNYELQQPYNNYYSNNFTQYAQSYTEQLPVFIRRAIPSDDEESETININNNARKYIQKTKNQTQLRPRFNSEDFPSFQKLNISSQPKQE